MEARTTGPDMAAELLKLLRGRWMTRHAIYVELGLHRQRGNVWVDGLLQNGLLIDRPAAVQRGGQDVREYTVAPAWVGIGP